MNTNFNPGMRFQTAAPAPATARGPAISSVPAEAPPQAPSDGFASAGSGVKFGTYQNLAGTPAASPNVGGTEVQKPKLSARDLEIAQDIRDNAADLEISLKDSMNLYFNGDSAAFELGMSPEQAAANRAEKLQTNQHIADYLGIGKEGESAPSASAPAPSAGSPFQLSNDGFASIEPEMKFSGYDVFSGTSMATPISGAGGIADLILGAYDPSRAPKPEVATFQGLHDTSTQQNFASKPIALME